MHPGLGCFMQHDPLKYQDGFNLYNYVNNTPLKYVDPMGTELYELPYYGVHERINHQSPDVTRLLRLQHNWYLLTHPHDYRRLENLYNRLQEEMNSIQQDINDLQNSQNPPNKCNYNSSNDNQKAINCLNDVLQDIQELKDFVDKAMGQYLYYSSPFVGKGMHAAGTIYGIVDEPITAIAYPNPIGDLYTDATEGNQEAQRARDYWYNMAGHAIEEELKQIGRKISNCKKLY